MTVWVRHPHHLVRYLDFHVFFNGDFLGKPIGIFGPSIFGLKDEIIAKTLRLEPYFFVEGFLDGAMETIHDKSFEQSELWAVFFVLFRGFVGDDLKLPSFLWGL